MKIITFLRFVGNLHSLAYRDKKDSISGTKAAAFLQRRNQAMSIRLGNIFKSSTVGLMTALASMTATFGFAQGDATKMADAEAGKSAVPDMTVDEYLFGDYNRATPITHDEAFDKSLEESSIVLMFTEEMSPRAAQVAYEFLGRRFQKVELHSGYTPAEDIPDKGQIFAWAGGYPVGPFVKREISSARALGEIERTAEDAGVTPKQTEPAPKNERHVVQN